MCGLCAEPTGEHPCIYFFSAAAAPRTRVAAEGEANFSDYLMRTFTTENAEARILAII